MSRVAWQGFCMWARRGQRVLQTRCVTRSAAARAHGHALFHAPRRRAAATALKQPAGGLGCKLRRRCRRRHRCAPAPPGSPPDWPAPLPLCGRCPRSPEHRAACSRGSGGGGVGDGDSCAQRLPRGSTLILVTHLALAHTLDGAAGVLFTPNFIFAPPSASGAAIALGTAWRDVSCQCTTDGDCSSPA